MVLVAIVLAFLSACGSVAVDDSGLEPNEPPPVQRVEWRSTDVGTVGVSGEVEVAPDAADLVVRGSGEDIWTDADSFHYVYMPVEGDVEIQARIDSLEETHDRAKVGVMLRSGLDAGAVHAMVGVTPAGQAQFIYRETTNGESDFVAEQRFGYPTWVRLTRSGNTVVAAYSLDGESWRQLGSRTIEFAEQLYVGIALTSRDQTRLGSAEVRAVHVADADGDVVGPLPPGSPPPGSPSPVTPPPVTPPPSEGPSTGWVCGDAPLTPRYAPTMYVSTSGSDSNDGRSIGRPVRTLQRAANLVVPGDVVWVREGVYSGNVTFERTGTASRPIVVESYPGECAVLDGRSSSSGPQVRLVGVSHYVFRNFIVRNAPAQGIYLRDSDDNLISHVRTHDNRLSGIQNIDSDRNRFAYFIAHDNFDPPSGGNADGIGLSSGNDNRIDHCVVYRNSDDGIDTWKSYDTIVERCIAYENGFQGGDGNGIKAGGGLRTNTIVRYSVAFGNRVQGFNYNSGDNITFEHNTSFDNNYYGFIAGDSVLRNNLAYNNARDEWQDNGGNSQVTNSWNLGSPNPSFLSTDPRSRNFLAISPSGRAVGAGTAIGLPFVGTRPDLGALPVGETIESFLGIALHELYD